MILSHINTTHFRCKALSFSIIKIIFAIQTAKSAFYLIRIEHYFNGSTINRLSWSDPFHWYKSASTLVNERCCKEKSSHLVLHICCIHCGLRFSKSTIPTVSFHFHRRSICVVFHFVTARWSCPLYYLDNKTIAFNVMISILLFVQFIWMSMGFVCFN